jgi:hypothetical protein
MTEAIDGDDERARLEEEIRKPIRPFVIRPKGFVVPDDPEAIRRENALMEELHEKEVVAARREKLKLPLRRYSLAEHDFEGLALALAIEHEPGFKVDRQIAEAPSGFVDAVRTGFVDAVRIKDGKHIDKPRRRPVQWPVERLLQLLEAVEAEKKKSRLTKDLDALKRLARQKGWEPPAFHRSNSPRGRFDAWVRTLQSRLHDAKKLKRKVDALNAFVEEVQRRGK